MFFQNFNKIHGSFGVMNKILFFIFYLFLSLGGVNVFGQCTTPINTFPYLQDFEVGNGGWITGGTVSSWSWGTPNKSVINSAGGGSKSWITGGLTSPAYNDGESSWVESPCFNFATLANPQVSFKIFWETERQFDGAGFEYSLNGGASWTLLGSASSNSNCKGVNWYNFTSVKYLGNTPGWSGNIQATVGSCQGGMGSGGWLTAKHTLINLAGKPSVKFRFTFGAGTQCNVYDGFAFDDFKIEEVPSNPSAFTYSCVNTNSIKFSTVSKICQTSTSWDFGDPASGSSNTSMLEEPTHTFSAAGQYIVKLTTTFSSGPSSSSTQSVTINDVNTSLTSPILCNGGTAIVTATSLSAGTFNYSWNTSPVQNTAVLSNVSAGSYTVTVTGNNSCAATSTINITEPSAINISLSSTNASCSANDGSISSVVTGGTGAYIYSWSNGATTPNLNNLGAGAYTLTVKDANNCSKVSAPVVISQAASNILLNPTISSAICTASNGAINPAVSGGTSPYTFVWSDGSTANSLNNLAAGSYSVTVKDALGCEKIFSNIVVPNTTNSIVVNTTVQQSNCADANGSITTSVSGGTTPYTYVWSNGSTTPNISNLSAGNYTVTVKDVNGCEEVKSVTVTQASSTLAINATATPSPCNMVNGSINVSVTGGTSPYSYLWSNGATTDNISGLAEGFYSVTVTDALGCTVTKANIEITQASATIFLNANSLPSKCDTNNGSITTTVSGGTSPYSFLWSDGSTTNNLIAVAPGNYSVKVTDANGCTTNLNNIEVNHVVENLNINLGEDKNVCPGQNIILNPGSYASYLWQDNSTAPTFTITGAGQYSVSVTDNFGCKGSDTIKIFSNCSGNVYFPSAFTPNGDNKNDQFGILGDFSGIRDYELIVYGRWGQKIFSTKNPLEKWDGTFQGKKLTTQTCVWVASFTINNRLPQIEKGTVVIIR